MISHKLFPPFLFVLLCCFSACRPSEVTEGATALDVAFKRTSADAIIRLEAAPDRLTPLLTTNNYAQQVMDNIFQPLMQPDPETLDFVPVLIKGAPEVAEINSGPFQGGIAYTFELLDEAVWSDGAPVTGLDYVFTLKALLNPRVQASPYRPYVSMIAAVEVAPDNAKRFTVYTAEKFFQSLEYITNTFQVLPAHHYDPEGLLSDIPLADLIDGEKAAQLAETDERLQRFADRFGEQRYGRDPGLVMGSGPYRLERWETGQEIVLTRKEDWWGEPLTDEYPALQAYPEQLIFQPIPDATTSIAAMKAEEIDAAYGLDPNGFQDLKTSDYTAERYDFYTPPLMAYSLISINTNVPELADKRVRRALAHSIDVQEIIDNVYNGYGQRLSTPVLPSFSYHDDELAPYAFDLERARALLAEAGWEDSNDNGIVDDVIDGERRELRLDVLRSANRETARNTALLIQDNARRVGIDINPLAQETSVMFDNLRKRDYELVLAGRGYAISLWNPQQNFHTAIGDNRTGFGNAETDALIDALVTTLDEERRNQIYGQLQQIIYEEVPEIPIFVPTARIAVHKRFDAEATSIYPGFIPKSLRLRAPFRQEAALK